MFFDHLTRAWTETSWSWHLRREKASVVATMLVLFCSRTWNEEKCGNLVVLFHRKSTDCFLSFGAEYCGSEGKLARVFILQRCYFSPTYAHSRCMRTDTACVRKIVDSTNNCTLLAFCIGWLKRWNPFPTCRWHQFLHVFTKQQIIYNSCVKGCIFLL